MEIYFENVPEIGDLAIEHIFYEYEEPILFVCMDRSQARYLCSCSKIGQQWLVGSITAAELVKIIDRRISLSDAFRDCKPLICIIWDGSNLSFTDRIPDNAFPKKDAYLRLPENAAGYREQLLKEISENKVKTEDILITYFQKMSEIFSSSKQVLSYICMRTSTEEESAWFSKHNESHEKAGFAAVSKTLLDNLNHAA